MCERAMTSAVVDVANYLILPKNGSDQPQLGNYSV